MVHDVHEDVLFGLGELDDEGFAHSDSSLSPAIALWVTWTAGCVLEVPFHRESDKFFACVMWPIIADNHRWGTKLGEMGIEAFDDCS